MNMQDFDRAIAQATTPAEAFDALQSLTRAVVGAKLFTVMVLDMEREVSSRTHTSHPQDYPVSGTKPINRTAWFNVVHGEQKPFVANTIEDIAEVFFDHVQIKALGCESVVNLPIILQGKVVGTVNLLDGKGFYTSEKVAQIEAQLSMPAKLAYLVWKQNGGRI